MARSFCTGMGVSLNLLYKSRARSRVCIRILWGSLTSMSTSTPLLIAEFSDEEDEIADGIRLNDVLDSGHTDVEPRDSNITHHEDRQLEYNAERGTVYEDFHTIDWVKDRNRNKERHRRMKRRQLLGWKAWFDKKWDAISGWVVVFLVGVCSGVLAGVIDIGAAWMSDLKEGICVPWPYYDREACCWLSNQTSFDVDHCDDWKTWAEQGGARDTSSYYSFSWFDYGIYIMFAMFFGGLAGFFVVTVAPYAAGSGIPEVRLYLMCFH